MKLYTKTGDDGSTGLFGGQRVGKDSLRVEAYGTVDELNCAVGLATAGCEGLPGFSVILQGIQNRLFELGADLATPRNCEGTSGIPRIGEAQATELEGWIDQTCSGLPEMKHFILPGGSEAAARLHVARTICRRAERLCVALGREAEIGPSVVVYLNRLSDLLFALARRANLAQGKADVPWLGRG